MKLFLFNQEVLTIICFYTRHLVFFSSSNSNQLNVLNEQDKLMDDVQLTTYQPVMLDDDKHRNMFPQV
jgi:hypothetical protein